MYDHSSHATISCLLYSHPLAHSMLQWHHHTCSGIPKKAQEEDTPCEVCLDMHLHSCMFSMTAIASLSCLYLQGRVATPPQILQTLPHNSSCCRFCGVQCTSADALAVHIESHRGPACEVPDILQCHSGGTVLNFALAILTLSCTLLLCSLATS